MALGLGAPALPASQPESDEGQELLRTDSGAPYVHRITLYDHDGAVIDPEDEFAGPYSPRTTCAKCHPYAEISHGWHFNAPDGSVPAGRPGEPWLLVDPQTGTQLPISARGWPGTFKLEDVGLTSWDFVIRFGHHTPGGGYGEPGNEQVQQSGKLIRWGISGKLEIDCMFCHAGDQQHDPAEQASQIEKENFRWAATAALGLAVIRGEARKAPDDWDPMMEPDPDFPEKAGPRLVWDKSRFDPDNRVLLNITRPPVDRCYFCHSFRQVGSQANQGVGAAQDVHLAAGLTCVDCHRNGLDHMMVRGYRTEAEERGEARVGAFSCEGCHLGVRWMRADAAVFFGGHYGAPHPEHKGIPPLHFEKLTCTACHSGPWPEMNAKRFQTALAHGLGLATRERKDDDPPRIVGPIFARQHDGRIAPQRMIWLAFWGGRVGDKILPIGLDVVRKAAAIARPEKNQNDHEPPERLTWSEILKTLEELASRESVEDPVYLREGKVYRSTSPGELDIFEYAAPYGWSIAHNVRPAAQSLGARGCTDCHADDAPIYFGRIADADDVQSVKGLNAEYMHQLRGDDAPLVKAWDFGFGFRPAFKWFGFLCAGVVALILLHYALAGIGAIARRFR